MEAAAGTDCSVYGFLQAYINQAEALHPTSEQMRAAASNFWAKGVDGLYSYFAHFPHGDAERRWMSEIGDPELMAEKTKIYHLAERTEAIEGSPYDRPLPLEVPRSGATATLPFFVSDDVGAGGAAADRVRQVVLSLVVSNLMAADVLDVALNGATLASEPLARDYANTNAPYTGQRLTFTLASEAQLPLPAASLDRGL